MPTSSTGKLSLGGSCSSSISYGGDAVYTTAGTYTWVAPAGVTKVSVVAVGGGAGVTCRGAVAGGGGSLGYKNNITVTPGSSYTVVVGAGGASSKTAGFTSTAGNSYFINTSTVMGNGAVNGTGASTYVGDGGGAGGNGYGVYTACSGTVSPGGGGGAGGYTGKGGSGGLSWTNYQMFGTDGIGGAGGGGSARQSLVGPGVNIADWPGAGAGGGTGLYGQTISGTASGNGSTSGSGGSGGASGTRVNNCSSNGQNGGLYGGGGSGAGRKNYSFCTPLLGQGAQGAVRIVWPGCARSFPAADVCASIVTKTSYSSVQYEISGTSSSQISLNCTSVRKMAGKTTPGSQISFSCLYGKSGPSTAAAGSTSYTNCGTYTWVAPAGVKSVSVVAVGGGGACGGTGGGLGYKNNITVTPGSSYTVVVGAGGMGRNGGNVCGGVWRNTHAKDSYFIRDSLVAGRGGRSRYGLQPTSNGGYVGDGGGNGKTFGGCAAGGGAGGYAGVTGSGGNGSWVSPAYAGGGGGGVGIFGQGASGTNATGHCGGGGGSGGTSGGSCLYSGGAGGLYGGGAGAASGNNTGASGGRGAVRIVWPGCARSFPSTCVGSP